MSIAFKLVGTFTQDYDDMKAYIVDCGHYGKITVFENTLEDIEGLEDAPEEFFPVRVRAGSKIELLGRIDYWIIKNIKTFLENKKEEERDNFERYA